MKIFSPPGGCRLGSAANFKAVPHYSKGSGVSESELTPGLGCSGLPVGRIASYGLVASALSAARVLCVDGNFRAVL